MNARRVLIALVVLAWGATIAATQGHKPGAGAWDPSDGMILEGTVVTMNAARDVLPRGRVLVRNGRIEAIWQGNDTPDGIRTTGAVRVRTAGNSLIFPGMINIHDHPLFGALPTWLPPSSHALPAVGRPSGLESYGNRYQWNSVQTTSPAEYKRLVNNAQGILNDPIALNLSAESVKYTEIKMLLGGVTATQGAPASLAYDSLLARNVDNTNFGRDRIDSRVASIGSLTGAALTSVRNRMANGQLEAWIAHLAEGVRDADRSPLDPTSSRAEFSALRSKGLLKDATVVVHGIGLEYNDFAEMAAAPPARADGVGDGLGAKLVWSPLSNLALYGRTTQVYDALAAGVTVALSTDWSPSGSPNLLGELKIADIAMRDPRVLGASRHLVPSLAIEDAEGQARPDAEAALDRLLVEMVTINAARAVRWDDQVGSIEPGKIADLIVVRQPNHSNNAHIPHTVYRSLIDATEADLDLVMVGGEPLAGDVDVMNALKPGDFEIVASAAGRFEKGIDVTNASSPKGTQSLNEITSMVAAGLTALGGDLPPAGGGPAPTTNTYSYLKARFMGTAAMSDLQFMTTVIIPFFGLTGGNVNLEAIQIAPLFAVDDDWWLAAVGGVRNKITGLPDDNTPPYKPYFANTNQAGYGENPFAREQFECRWYRSHR